MNEKFLAIIESFMHNNTYSFENEQLVTLEQLFKISQKHKVTSIVYEQLRTSPLAKNPEYKDFFAFWKRSVVRDVMLQIQRTEGFLEIYTKMLEAGLVPLVVKGMICRNLYNKPDYRVSGDEDMLLPREQFETCDEIFLKEGFQREKLDMEQVPHEISYVNPRNGVYVELHLSLFPEESGAYGHLNDEFRYAYEKKVMEEIQGKKVWTLCPTDHIFYLICHSFKHFLHSGFGIRQVCDMVMMAEYYGKEIDWHYILKCLERLNMKDYWNALIKIGIEYLGFSLTKAAYPVDEYDGQVDCMPLLEDLMDSGIYGDSSMERKHSSNMTLTAVTAGKVNTIASLGTSLFPSMSYMKSQFTWLGKYPWLIPVAYLARIVRYLKNRKRKGINSVQIGMDRIELLRKYHIIE